MVGNTFNWVIKGIIPIVIFVLWSSGGFLGAEKARVPDDTTNPWKIKKGAEVIVVKGSTRHWKDADKTPLNLRATPRRPRPVLNFEIDRPIVRFEGETDPVVQRDFGRKGQQRLTPQNSATIEAMNYNSDGSGWPPDTTGDVGPTYYVQAVNTSIGIYLKSTGQEVSTTTFDSFFGGGGITGTPCDSQNNGDPIVLYDVYAQRWFILDFAWDSSETDGSYFSIAVSKTSNPTGEWWQYALRADNTLLNDYPKVGIWNDAIYITANMFPFSGGGMQHVKIWALKKPDIYSGTLTAQATTEDSVYAGSILPANAKSPTPVPADTPNYMYSLWFGEWGGIYGDSLLVWKYDVDWNTPANTAWSGPTAISAAACSPYNNNIPQKGTSNQLDALAYRLMYPAMYRNFGTHESVYLCHLVSSGGTAAMRWYEVRISGGGSSIFQQGTYSPDSHHRWMGSVGGNENGDILLAYSASSSTLYPGIRCAGRLASDPAGQLSQGETELTAGGGYQSVFDRWGDYSTMTVDPVDDTTFWFTTEYYSSSGTNWKTRLHKVQLSTPPSVIPDFNSDGSPDLLLRNLSHGSNQVWYMDGASKTGSASLPKIANTNWLFEATGDFNSDGNVDILLRNYSDGSNQLWFMNGVSKSSYSALPQIPDTGWQFVAVADFNSDDKPDIVMRHAGSGYNQVWYMNGATKTGQASLPTITNAQWKIEGAADFNNDGNPDLILRNTTFGTNQVWYMDGVTKTGSATLPRIPDINWRIVGAEDFNGDDKPDLLLRNYQYGTNQVWYMNGVTKTGSATLPRIPDTYWKINNN